MARLLLMLLAAASLVAAPAAAEEHQVSQHEKVFTPVELTVKAGDEIEFLNDDEISHNVFSRSEAARFNLKIQRPGENKKYKFEKPGSVVIRCAIHPKMKMTVQVEPAEEVSAAAAGEPCTVGGSGPGETHCNVDPSTKMTVPANQEPAEPPAAPEQP